jgi:deazaflavin-dependent oxidoreductase (nitroreductase family)
MVARALNRSSRSRFGQFLARHVAPKVDPWLGRISNGRASLGMFNIPSATLKTTGAKSGALRVAQVAYFHDGPDVVVLASNYGGDKHPQWYHNLVAHPDCELGGEALCATEVTDPDAYARLFGLAEQYFALFADYRAKSALTGRKIPVFLLTPRAA